MANICNVLFFTRRMSSASVFVVALILLLLLGPAAVNARREFAYARALPTDVDNGCACPTGTAGFISPTIGVLKNNYTAGTYNLSQPSYAIPTSKSSNLQMFCYAPLGSCNANGLITIGGAVITCNATGNFCACALNAGQAPNCFAPTTGSNGAVRGLGCIGGEVFCNPASSTNCTSFAYLFPGLVVTNGQQTFTGNNGAVIDHRQTNEFIQGETLAASCSDCDTLRSLLAGLSCTGSAQPI